MAKLKNPPNNLEAIRQDYKDKHASAGGALFGGRKYDRQVKKDGQFKFDKAGNPIMWRPYVQLRQLITDVSMYIDQSFLYSEYMKNDCYATINSFLADCTARTADNVAYLTGYYIDFDYKQIHNLAKKQQTPELVEEALGYADQIVHTLADYLPSDYGMPVISYTGGGYGFYFRLAPMEATEQNKALYMEIWEKLYQRFNVLFADISDVFENDHAVVGDIVRVIRITGTYNDKTGAFARYIARYGNAATNEVYTYKLDEIISLYHLDDLPKTKEEPNTHLVSLAPLPKKREKKEKEAIGPIGAIKASSYTKQDNNILHPIKWYQGFVNATQIGKYLELATTSLWYLNEQGSLQRNNALFLIACLETEIAYAQYGSRIFSWNKVAQRVQQEIIDDIIEINEGLSEPLEDHELAAILNHALSNNYHFRKLDTIQKFLNLTDEEFESLGWMDGKKRRKQWQEHNNALTELDKEVIRLYLGGLSDAKIAKELGIPKLQSIRIRKRLGVMDRNMKFESIDFDGNKRHLLHKTHSISEAPPETPEMRRLAGIMRRIADSRICDIAPARYRDFLDKPSTDLFHYLIDEIGLEKTEVRKIDRAYYKQRSEYIRIKWMWEGELEEALEARKQAAEAKQAEQEAKQEAKLLRSDTWFCHDDKFNLHNHAKLVESEMGRWNLANSIEFLEELFKAE